MTSRNTKWNPKPSRTLEETLKNLWNHGKIIEDDQESDENYPDIVENHGKIGENKHVAIIVQIYDVSYPNLRLQLRHAANSMQNERS